jgi:hypothetical protein
MSIDWPRRIARKATHVPGGGVLLEIIERPKTRARMIELIRDGESPVRALSRPLVDAVGREAALHGGLRQLSGQAVAHVAEREFGAVRLRRKQIRGDEVYRSGITFRLGGRVRLYDRDPEAEAIRALARKLRRAMTEKQRAIFAEVFVEAENTAIGGLSTHPA